MAVDPWTLVPGLTATEALAVLAVAAIPAAEPRGADRPLVTVDAVAALTGMSVDTASGALQRAQRKGRLGRVDYLGSAANGRAVARVGYCLAEKGGE